MKTVETLSFLITLKELENKTLRERIIFLEGVIETLDNYIKELYDSIDESETKKPKKVITKTSIVGFEHK
jgi:hypothetical protein